MKLPHTAWAPIALGAALCLAIAVPAAAAPRASEMRDLPPDHWAYQAIQQLVERYGVLEGFPDDTFRGTKTVTRYELAAALTRVMQRMDAMSTGRPATSTPRTPVNPADKATIDRLRREFAAELAQVKGLSDRVASQEVTLSDLKKAFDERVTVTGSISSTFADDTLDQGKDRSAAYISTGLSLGVAGNVNENITFNGSFGGGLKASGSGDRPAVLGGGAGLKDDYIHVRGAYVTTKFDKTTLRVGRFGTGGPGTDLSFKTGDFLVGVGGLGPTGDNWRGDSDIGARVSTELGPVNAEFAANSYQVLSKFKFSLGPATLATGYETDLKALTQNVFNTGQRVRTTDNAVVALDIGSDDWPAAISLHSALTNLNLTHYGGAVRGAVAGIDLNGIVRVSSDPGRSITVASFGGLVGLPAYTVPLFGGFQTPGVLFAALDNYTIDAPAGSGTRPTTGPGGAAMGKNAGFSVNVDLPNPWIPNLSAEYNAEAALIEGIFVPSPSIPITTETFVLRTAVDF